MIQFVAVNKVELRVHKPSPSNEAQKLNFFRFQVKKNVFYVPVDSPPVDQGVILYLSGLKMIPVLY